MRSKTGPVPIRKFVLRFMLIFAILIAPWPGLSRVYSNYFRSLGQMAFSSDDGKRQIVFAPNDAKSRPNLDSKLTLANRDLLDSHGKGLRVETELDSRSIGWVPTALTMALILATPISLRRRCWALAGGLVLVHCFILFTLQSWIWNNSPDVSLITMSTWTKRVTDELDYALINQIGASFSIPVLIWVLVTFRRQDALDAI